MAAAGADATICFASGDYRLSAPLYPAAGQTLVGAKGATLIGSKTLTGFSSAGGGDYSAAYEGELGEKSGECRSGNGGACRMPNALFLDGRPLRRVMSKAALTGESFWYDSADHEFVIAFAPSNHRIEVAVTPTAIAAKEAADVDVTLEGLTVERFANRAQHGAIEADASGWTIRGDTVELNHGPGISSEGYTLIEDVDASENGQEGISGTGADMSVIHCAIDRNNWAGFDPGWEAGGGKWSAATELVVRDNRVRDNQGPGLWSDVDSAGVTYEDNDVAGNERAGIFFEISEAGRIEGNHVSSNGFGMNTWLWGSGILLAASHDVLVSGNQLVNNADGIGLIQQDRGTNEKNGEPRVLHEIDVEDNQERLGEGSTGLVEDDGDEALFTDPTIRFEKNTYTHYEANAFLWDNLEVGPAEWQAYGHDREGTFRG